VNALATSLISTNGQPSGGTVWLAKPLSRTRTMRWAGFGLDSIRTAMDDTRHLRAYIRQKPGITIHQSSGSASAWVQVFPNHILNYAPVAVSKLRLLRQLPRPPDRHNFG